MVKNKKNPVFIVYLLVSLIGSLFFLSCNEEPTIVGYSFIKDTIAVYPISSNDVHMISGSEYYRQDLNLLNANFFLGRHENDDGLTESIALMRIIVPDTLGDVPVIHSAKLRLSPSRYAFGGADTLLGNLSFKIYELIQLYTDETSYDSLFPVEGQSPYLDYSSVIGQYTGGIPLRDSLERDYIEIDIDTALVRKFLVIKQNAAEGDTILNGIGFIPDESSTVINTFRSSAASDDYVPLLIVAFTNKENEVDTLKATTTLESSYTKAPFTEYEDRFMLQGGVSYRTNMKFDLSMLPPLAAVHKAELELVLDPELSRAGNILIDSATVISALTIYDTTGEDGLYVESFAEKEVSADKFIFSSIVYSAEVWTREGGTGNLLLRYGSGSNNPSSATYEERILLNRLVFYGPTIADSSLMPKLRIIYSTRPDNECNK